MDTIKNTESDLKIIEINRILIPTDFSETANIAMAHGAYMAQLFNAKIFLLHCVEAIDEFNSATKSMNKIAEDLKNTYQVEVITLTDNRSPVTGIRKAVDEHQIDIIVMGTHGASGFKEFFVGSNAQKIVHFSPCPVITIQASAERPVFKNIILPIDNLLYSRQKVDDVIVLASKYGAVIHIIGLLDTHDKFIRRGLEMKIDTVEKAIKKAKLSFTRNIVNGENLAIEAIKHSAEANGDLIVIMTEHESELKRALVPPMFTQQIVNHSKIPVMSIKTHKTMVGFEAIA